MRETVLETARLRLRPFRAADAPAYRAIRARPGVTRFLPSHSDDPDAAAARADAALAAFAAAWAADGYGPWAVERREAPGAAIGHLGLRRLAEMGGETELLFLIDPAHQGRGLATEGARAALDWGFGTLGLVEIVAYALPQNAPSCAVLTRAGMNREAGLCRAFGLDAVRFTARPG